VRYFSSKINRKVLAITLLPAVLVAVLLTLSSSIKQTTTMEKSLSERGLSIVRQLAPACEYGVYSANQDILRPLVESVMSEPNVISVVILDEKGNTLIRGDDKTADSANIDFTSTQPSIMRLDQNNSWSFYAPIYQSEFILDDFSREPNKSPASTNTWKVTDHILGWVSVELSLVELNSIKTSAWINTIVVAVSVLIFGSLLALHMGRSITNPVTKLMRAVDKVEQGNLDIQVDTGASGELKSLENGINKMARALKESHDGLESKVEKATEDLRNVLEALAENNSELEAARRDAEQANKEKSAFLANISHEIRTPLHGVKGFTQLLSETNLQEEQKVYLDRITTSVNTLTTLLNDLLDFSKLEVSKLKLEYDDFHVFTLIDDVVTLYGWEANNKGLELISVVAQDIPEYLYGSGSRIAQIMRNLVSNAIKFTSDGEVCIHLEKIHSEKTGHYRLSVTDTGIGIPPHERSRLFQPFSQLESGTRKNYSGVGLGLVISKTLTELMDGHIFVNSIQGIGTSFSVELPLGDNAMRDTQPQTSTLPMPCWILSPITCIQESLEKAFLRRHAKVMADSSLPRTEAELPDEIRTLTNKTLMIIDAHFNDTEITQFLSLLNQNTTAPRAVPVLLETADECTSREQLSQSFPYRLKRPLTYLALDELITTILLPETQPLHSRTSSNGSLRLSPSDQLPKRVLLVDDNLINREFLNIWMTKAGISVDEAKNGKEALNAYTVRNYDLILMDLHMPDMDGFQTIEAINNGATKTKNCRIFAITADATEETISQIADSAFDGFLIKPVSQETLLTVLSGQHTPEDNGVHKATPQPGTIETQPEIVDQQQGLRYASGNLALWHWSLKTLAQRLPNYRDKLKLAIDNQDHDELFNLLHAIQGAASYCGATDLICSIKQLRLKVKDETNEAFETEYFALRNSISSFILWVDRQSLD
jgi:two-component system, NarL family, sensor histidine kinase BarA